MPRLTEAQLAARAHRDLYSTRIPLSTWGIVMRLSLAAIWLASVVYRIFQGTEPTWLTVIFAIAFTVLAREVWDAFRRRRYDRWHAEQIFKGGTQ